MLRWSSTFSTPDLKLWLLILENWFLHITNSCIIIATFYYTILYWSMCHQYWQSCFIRNRVSVPITLNVMMVSNTIMVPPDTLHWTWRHSFDNYVFPFSLLWVAFHLLSSEYNSEGGWSMKSEKCSTQPLIATHTHTHTSTLVHDIHTLMHRYTRPT